MTPEAAAPAAPATPALAAGTPALATPAPAGAAAPAAAAPAAAPAAPAGAPAAYSIVLPAGSRLSASDVKRLEAVARTNNWTNDDAQAYVAETEANLSAQAAEWIEETRADKDLGGDKLEATQQLTRKGIDFLFPANDPHRAGFLEFLNRGGAGNNIHVVRALARIGKAQAEDGNISGSGGDGHAPRSAEDVLYKPIEG